MTEVGLELLMAMIQKVLDSQREMGEDIREIKTRLGRLETEVAQRHSQVWNSLGSKQDGR